jgi:aromatic-L-amino-acid decarboxylase
VDKAALLAGFGRENIRHVACDARYGLDPDALAAAIVADRDAGRVPCAVVATTGTTTTTAIDPVAAIARVLEGRGI